MFDPPVEKRKEPSISAFSQYKWHQPSILQDIFLNDDTGRILNVIMGEIRQIHGEILTGLGDTEMDRLLLQQGFSFDVMYCEETKKCCLINSMGSE